MVNGMNNRARPESLPEPTQEFPYNRARNAVNVLFDSVGNIRFPRPGRTLLYAGDCHSIYKTSWITLFVEDGDLKSLNDDNTATILKADVGDNKMFYTTVLDTIYFSNGLVTGKVRDGAASEWGTEIPPRQPDCTAISTGGMYEGEYLVAMTWIADEEGGTGNSVKVTVPSGGGIQLSNFPTPPDYVQGLAIYVSEANSENLYLYDEYLPNTSSITLRFNTGVIPLATQFGDTPKPKGMFVYHYGRIYYPEGPYLFYTDAQRYGITFADCFLPFDGTDIQTVISRPGVLYVGTKANLFEVRGLDGDDAPTLKALTNCGSVPYSETYDPDGDEAYFMSNRGVISGNEQTIVEITYDQCAIPFFGKGASTVVEYDGTKYYLFSGQDGQQNPLANKDYNTSELARGSL